jgi:ADP-heptose:LPS heptosyltransferase
MGDVAMLVPILVKLIKSNPQVKITLLTQGHFTPIFSSFSNITIVEADVKGKHKGFLGLYRLYRELKLLNVNHIADVHNVLRSNILKLFFKINGTPFVQIDKGRKEKAALTRATNKVFRQLKTTHQRYADVFEKLGFKMNLNKVELLENNELSNSIKIITGEKKQHWIGIAPFAAHEGKMYPLELMKEVISALVKDKKQKVLLFGGGKSEVDKLINIESEFAGEVVNCAGKLSFNEELNVISNLDVMLSMDSGNGHLAANYGVPVITLWGVTHPYAGFAPFGQPIENALLADRENYPLIPTSIYGNKVPEGYDNVIKTILPDDVVQKILEVIK